MTAPATRPPARSTVSRRHGSTPYVGIALTAIGAVHLLLTPVFYGDAVRSVIDAGVLASVEADPALADLRAAGFWYATAGLGVIALGVVVAWAQREVGHLPVALAWLLAALGVWGIALMPLSPFWAFLVLAVMAFRSTREA